MELGFCIGSTSPAVCCAPCNVSRPFNLEPRCTQIKTERPEDPRRKNQEEEEVEEEVEEEEEEEEDQIEEIVESGRGRLLGEMRQRLSGYDDDGVVT